MPFNGLRPARSAQPVGENMKKCVLNKSEREKMDVAWNFFFSKIGEANRVHDLSIGYGLCPKAIYLADILQGIDDYYFGKTRMA